MKPFGLVGFAIHVFQESAVIAPPLMWIMCASAVMLVLCGKNGFGLRHLTLPQQYALVALGPITILSAMITTAIAGDFNWMQVTIGRHGKIPDVHEKPENDWFFSRYARQG